VSARRVVLGLDGSRYSRRATAFLARLSPWRGGRVLCVRVVEPMRVPSAPLLSPSMRGQLAGQAAAFHRSQVAIARRQVDDAAARLERSGWRARGDVRAGVPLAELLAAARAVRADLLVLGARGAGAVTHFLLGSVAEAVLKHARVPVLIVK
jgi:nucleotide-binding universal stress UspA family protein